MLKNQKLNLPKNRSSFFIAFIYVFISSLWIIYSDKLVGLIAGDSAALLSFLQTVKGGFFVISTGFLLYFLIQSRMKNIQLSEARFKTLAENTPDAIICFDAEGKYIYGNSVFEKFLQIPANELIGKNFQDFNFNKNLNQLWDKAFNKVLLTKKTERIEYTFPEGTSIDVILSPQLSKSKEIILLIASSRNITEFKNIQEQLQQSQKMRAIGQLAGGIAHDFNNILGVIVGYTDLAINKAICDPVQKEYLMNIQKANMRAKDLVKQIVAFSRNKSDDPKPILLKPIVKEIMAFLKASVPSSIVLTSHIEKDIKPVLADSSKVHEIVMNLVTNAQFAVSEKGKIEINLFEKIFEMETIGIMGPVTIGEYSIIEVKDNGIGISPEKINRIFEPFFTTKKAGEGTGLGLSVVYGLMKSWQGNIQVDSIIDGGTSIRLLFPKIEKREIEEKQLRTISSLKRGHEKILVVDDDLVILKMAEKMLKSLGYEVEAVNDSEKALELLKNNIKDYDLLISDQTMPNMTGIELAEEILTQNPNFPILLCTGYSSKVNEGTARKIGCRGLLNKPLTFEELSDKVRDILG